MDAVEIKHVTKTYGQHRAVDDLSLTVPAGSVYGFIGPNGSGKTTTLRMTMGIIYPDANSGLISVLGQAVVGAARDRVSYLPEERGLYKKMKVRDVLQFAARLKGCRDCKKETEQWLDRLDMADWGEKKVEALSKGMAQKIQFIAAIISKPDLLILDEPFTGLDPVNTNVVRDAILDVRAAGTTVIFSTHDMGVAEEMCDFIFMIFKGCKVLDGTLESIQDRYGADIIRVRVDTNGSSDPTRILADLPGIERINDFGNLQELRMSAGTDSQAVLRTLVDRATVRHFELAKPSLHDIFVRIANPDEAEVIHE